MHGLHFAFLHGSNDLYGASRVLLDDVGMLVHEGARVDVGLPNDGPLTDRLDHEGARVHIENLRVLRRVTGSVSSLPAGRLPGFVSTADVAVPWTLAMVPYLPALQARRRPTVCSVHEILPDRRGGALAAAASVLSPRMMANSFATSAWLTRHARRRTHIEVAYPVAPRYDPLPILSEPKPLRLLLAGRVNGHKGHLETARTVRCLRDRGVEVELTLAGGAYPGQDRHLSVLQNEIRGASGITYVGEVDDIRSLLRNVHALVIPTTRPEPFGIVALEAWSAGRPVIASDEGGLAEAARLVGGRLVRPRDNRDLALKIEALANNTSAVTTRPDAEAAKRCTRSARLEAWRSIVAAIT
jgi:glycosyltransferase involved in cell wall biosynthesis